MLQEALFCRRGKEAACAKGTTAAAATVADDATCEEPVLPVPWSQRGQARLL